ncbi:MAG: NADH-quinone oxidoreductase subunit N [Nitriliruptoraceae bacterium]
MSGLEPGLVAPELLATGAALVLLLLAVSRRRPQLVMLPVGLGSIALGAWMVIGGARVPGVVVAALGGAAPLLPVLLPGRATLQQAWGGGLALAGALVLTGWQLAVALGDGGALGVTGWRGSIAVDGLATFTRLTVYLAALLVIPMGYGYLQERRINRAEVEPLILLAAVGMALLGAANDLITIVIALEVLSFALYVLAGLARRDRRSQESSLKYFVSGAVASAVLLYGMALLYLVTGSLDLPAIGAALSSVLVPGPVLAVALVLVAVGVGFKVALAPFHLWAPDVYQGAPTSVTALMAAATKAAAFALLLRMALVAFPALGGSWAPALAVLAAASMLYGAVAALVQADLKRILAYSSVTHAGYAAIGVVARSTDGLGATMTYLLTYAVGSLAAFGVVIAVERRRRGEVTLATIRGLGRTSPLLAGILSLALLSLAGIPLTAGFIGKLEVFRAGVAAGWTWLVVVGVLSSVIAAGFYLRIAGVMFLEEAPAGADADAAGDGDDERLPVLSTGLSAATALSAALVLVVGLQPALLLELAAQASVLVR